MKTIKMFQIAVVILVLSILVGCSDQITAPPVSNVKPKSSGKKINEPEELSAANSFNTQIRLKPHRSYTFNFSNTGLVRFNAIEIQDLSINPGEDKYVVDCQDISVYGTTKDNLALLSCHSKGFDLREITVENLSSRFLDLSVTLIGVKAKKNPATE